MIPALCVWIHWELHPKGRDLSMQYRTGTRQAMLNAFLADLTFRFLIEDRVNARHSDGSSG